MPARIGFLDTSLGSRNLGDHIIAASVDREFPHLASAPRVATHQLLGPAALRTAASCDVLMVTGTNALGSKYWPPSPWRLGPAEIAVLRRRVAPIGVGWRDYEGRMSAVARSMYRRVFYPGLPVSVRDEYTKRQLEESGFEAINTGCPTTWSLPDDVPTLASEDEVVTTITDYRPDRTSDEAMLTALSNAFSVVHLWPQGSGDRAYINSLRLSRNVIVAESTLATFESLLPGRAYFGTRLHAGIRALQLGSPASVVAIDNRAIEIARDTGLPTVERTASADAYAGAIDAMAGARSLTIARDQIDKWRGIAGEILGVALKRG